MYHFIYITNLPSFYKINLFNKIAEQKKILVVFTHNDNVNRNEDFYQGKRDFEFISIANKSLFVKILWLLKLLRNNSYQTLILGGWDQMFLWIAAFISKKNKNTVVIESSIYESKTTGFKGFIKKIFISRISKAFCSGSAQAQIVQALGFTGEIVITKGVGIFNLVKQPSYIELGNVTDYAYVGRFSPEKNLIFLITVFNDLPDLKLHLIGFGPQESKLKQIANKNVIFHGAIENKKISSLLQRMHVFVLPSLSEPWGLVVEEALNNGLPVVVSDRVGCLDEIVTPDVGISFQFDSAADLNRAINKITDLEFYNNLRSNISKLDFDKITLDQVESYL